MIGKAFVTNNNIAVYNNSVAAFIILSDRDL